MKSEIKPNSQPYNNLYEFKLGWKHITRTDLEVMLDRYQRRQKVTRGNYIRLGFFYGQNS